MTGFTLKATAAALLLATHVISTAIPMARLRSVAYNNTNSHTVVGCFADTALGGHVLDGISTTSEMMTVSDCASFCHGYPFYGLQLPTSCYCGDRIRADSLTRPRCECSGKCAGDTSQQCGGPERIKVYKNDWQYPTTSSGTPSASTTVSSTSTPLPSTTSLSESVVSTVSTISTSSSLSTTDSSSTASLTASSSSVITSTTSSMPTTSGPLVEQGTVACERDPVPTVRTYDFTTRSDLDAWTMLTTVSADVDFVDGDAGHPVARIRGMHGSYYRQVPVVLGMTYTVSLRYKATSGGRSSLRVVGYYGQTEAVQLDLVADGEWHIASTDFLLDAEIMRLNVALNADTAAELVLDKITVTLQQDVPRVPIEPAPALDRSRAIKLLDYTTAFAVTDDAAKNPDALSFAWSYVEAAQGTVSLEPQTAGTGALFFPYAWQVKLHAPRSLAPNDAQMEINLGYDTAKIPEGDYVIETVFRADANMQTCGFVQRSSSDAASLALTYLDTCSSDQQAAYGEWRTITSAPTAISYFERGATLRVECAVPGFTAEFSFASVTLIPVAKRETCESALASIEPGAVAPAEPRREYGFATSEQRSLWAMSSAHGNAAVTDATDRDDGTAIAKVVASDNGGLGVAYDLWVSVTPGATYSVGLNALAVGLGSKVKFEMMDWTSLAQGGAMVPSETHGSNIAGVSMMRMTRNFTPKGNMLIVRVRVIGEGHIKSLVVSRVEGDATPVAPETLVSAGREIPLFWWDRGNTGSPAGHSANTDVVVVSRDSSEVQANMQYASHVYAEAAPGTWEPQYRIQFASTYAVTPSSALSSSPMAMASWNLNFRLNLDNIEAGGLYALRFKVRARNAQTCVVAVQNAVTGATLGLEYLDTCGQELKFVPFSTRKIVASADDLVLGVFCREARKSTDVRITNVVLVPVRVANA